MAIGAFAVWRSEMSDTATAAEEFWRLFALRAAELGRAESADEPVYGELLERLQRVDSGLYFEFSTGAPPHELIITADGKRSLFPLARQVVAVAPPVEGWSVRALKPK